MQVIVGIGSKQPSVPLKAVRKDATTYCKRVEKRKVESALRTLFNSQGRAVSDVMDLQLHKRAPSHPHTRYFPAYLQSLTLMLPNSRSMSPAC
jgi:hypothetical protein